RQLPGAARAQDPAPAHAGALRQRAGAGGIPAAARRGPGRDLPGPAHAPAARAGEAADGRLRRHRQRAPEGRLRSRQATVRAHPPVHPGRIAGWRGKPGQPPGGDDPCLAPRGHPRAPGHRPGTGAAERGGGGAGGPARGSGECAVVNRAVQAPVGAVAQESPRAPGHLWQDLVGSFRHPEFWALLSWLDILVRSRRSYLGPLWLLASTAIYVFGIGAFFAGMHGKTMSQFAAHVALGVVVFRTLMTALITSTGVFTGSHSFIMDGRTRLTD